MRKELIFQVNGRNHMLGRTTWLMGIINMTPDSFSDGGRYSDPQSAVEQGLAMLDEGAEILDIGGESTRPGAAAVSAEEETDRVIPVIEGIRRHTDALISVDTTKSKVLTAALAAGADILNDISAMRADPHMLFLAAEKQIPVILMHMRGTPQTMQKLTHYSDLLEEIKTFFERQVAHALEAGIKKECLVMDPGIGFAKNGQQNLRLIRNLNAFNQLKIPVAIGVSRKSFLGQILDLPPEQRVEGTIAACLLAMQAGAHILRVHDVGPVKRAVRVAEAILAESAVSDTCEPDTGRDESHVH